MGVKSFHSDKMLDAFYTCPDCCKKGLVIFTEKRKIGKHCFYCGYNEVLK